MTEGERAGSDEFFQNLSIKQTSFRGSTPINYHRIEIKIMTLLSNWIFRGSCRMAFVAICFPVFPFKAPNTVIHQKT